MTMKPASVSAVIVSAGNSSRMGMGINKQFLMIHDKPVLIHTLKTFDSIAEINEIIVVAREEDIFLVEETIKDYQIQKVSKVVPGGASRQESVCHGLSFVSSEKVLIHDGARPFVSQEEIISVIHALSNQDAVVLGVPVKDTIKRISANQIILETVPREKLVAMLTPQGFTTKVILQAYQKVKEDAVLVTDDASVAEYAGISVKVIPGNYCNIKITTPEDLKIAKGIYGED